MTNEEAILILKQYMPKPSRGNGKFMQTLTITEAFLLAIKALDEQINTQRPKGEWKYNKIEDIFICSVCSSGTRSKDSFCSNCGAEMEVKEW